VDREHTYKVGLTWTGNPGEGTRGYSSYSRNHELRVEGKPVLEGSSDPLFRGDPTRYNPEELLVASLSSCHLLWYLHLCAEAGVVVVEYTDQAIGRMEETGRGGQFVEVTLRPAVLIAQGSDEAVAERLHEQAHSRCFIASSVNFPVSCEPRIRLEV
jgi:organic hydroperoxide reductase OsmC/OhrA